LRHCLTGYLCQTVKAFEVVIADDGSTDHTKEVIQEFSDKAPFPIRHVRHDHEGHRRASILNKGISECSAPIILFTDCDSIPMNDLLQVHLQFDAKDKMLCGGYIRLTEKETDEITPPFILQGQYEEFLTPERKRRLRRRHLKDLLYRALWKSGRPTNIGLNYSVRREHLDKINGYDEQFKGWGGADEDVRRRLQMVGVSPKSIWTQAVVLHQYHKAEPSKNITVRKKNQDLARRENVSAYCLDGIKKQESA
jgi:glycosyltransferase involved in cell wall biosynthesis